MHRSVSALLFAAIVVLVACSGGGSDGIFIPIADRTGDIVDHPKAGGWDPFASDLDPTSGAQDFPGCATQPTAAPLEILRAIVDPICVLAKQCGPSSATTPDAAPDQGDTDAQEAGDEVDEASASDANDSGSGDTGPGGGLSPMGLTLGPEECSKLLAERSIATDLQVTDSGYVGLCQIISAMVDRLTQHPECAPPIKVQAGVCLGALQRCLADITAQGCSLDDSLLAPASCRDLKFGTDETVQPEAPQDGG
jgi:hypothetical protein